MNKKALVVGIDNYPSKPLTGCVNDARAVAQLFARHGNGEPNFDVELITAPQANADGTIPQPDNPETENSPKGGITKAVLGRKILDLFNNGNPDIALFYFSGHGMITSVGGLILTSDFQDWSEGIPMNDLLAYANQSKAREKIIILDCCHSGAFGTPGTDGRSEISEGMVVLSAAMPAQEAIEEKGHGIFTSLLAEALDGAAADLLGQVLLTSYSGPAGPGLKGCADYGRIHVCLAVPARRGTRGTRFGGVRDHGGRSSVGRVLAGMIPVFSRSSPSLTLHGTASDLAEREQGPFSSLPRSSTQYTPGHGREPGRPDIDDCVHCGFCLPTCPTYLLWGEEMNWPRGQIYLMKLGAARARWR